MPASKKNPSITFRLEGSPTDKGKVRFGEFKDFLKNLDSCLRETDLSVSGSGKLSVYYRIIGLKAESATITLEAVPYSDEGDIAEEVLDKFATGLDYIQKRKQLPRGYNFELIEKFKQLAEPLRKNVEQIEVIHSNITTTITKQLEANIEAILGEDIKSDGSIAGFLDVVNVHEKNRFYIYPLVGPKKIVCEFPSEMLDTVRKALKSYVSVAGTLRYKKQETFPHQVDAKEIEIYPSEEELPTLESLRGMAPKATGGLGSVEFIRKIRNADET